MPATVEVPLWLAIAISVLASLAAARMLVVPLFRLYRSRRRDKVVDRVNAQLRLSVPAFLMTKRAVIVDRLLFDDDVQALVAETAKTTGQSQLGVMSRVQRYANEIVPAFSVYFYFRLGYWVARWLLRLHYTVRTAFVDNAAFDQIDSNCTVVMVLNHRSNMDVLLVNYLASRRSTLSHAAGEWARLWPLQHLVRAAGNYVVDRDAKDPLYRCVLQRYVVMATAAGVHQAIFPEGQLSRDGKMHDAKLGLMTYMTKAFDPAGQRDILFIPVGVNYDQIPEDRKLVYEQEKEFKDRGTMFLIKSSLRYMLGVAALTLRKRENHLGHACASFGHPISWRAWLDRQQLGAADIDRTQRYRCVAALAERLTREIERIIPVLPVPIVAAILVSDPDRTWTLSALQNQAGDAIAALKASGAQMYLPGEGADTAAAGLRILVRRKVVVKTDAGYKILPSELPLLRYYANSIAHLMVEETAMAQA